MTRLARGWRVAALVAGLLLLVDGTARGNDDLWPFGPMSQFAFRVERDGEIRSTFVTALTTDGRVVRVPLTSSGAGVGRAEIEGQLPRIVRDPSLLDSVAEGWRRQHPDEPGYVHLWLRQSVIPLRDGRPGTAREETLAEWAVQTAGPS